MLLDESFFWGEPADRLLVLLFQWELPVRDLGGHDMGGQVRARLLPICGWGRDCSAEGIGCEGGIREDRIACDPWCCIVRASIWDA